MIRLHLLYDLLFNILYTPCNFQKTLKRIKKKEIQFRALKPIVYALRFVWTIVYVFQVSIDGYSIVQNDRNRKVVGVACYIRSNSYYSRKTSLSDDLVSQDKTYTYIEYKPLSQTQILEEMITLQWQTSVGWSK